MPIGNKFPDDWKVACLNLLRGIREEMRVEQRREVLGWDKIRHLIMQPYDRAEGGTSARLAGSTLDAWDRRGDASISDGKFRYVDEYVRRIAFQGTDRRFIKLTHEQRFRDRAKALAALYFPRESQMEPIGLDTLPPWAGISLLADDVPQGVLSIGLRCLSSYQCALQIQCVMFPAGFKTQAIDPSKLWFFEGVMVPVINKSALMKDSDLQTTRYVINIFREEFAGHMDFGYASGELTSIFNGEDKTLVISGPKSIFIPEALQKPGGLIDHLAETDTEEMDDVIPILSNDRSYVTSSLNRTSDFVDNLFAQYYRGYFS